MTDDSLISAKQPDGFTTESPIRAFTDFSVNGLYAIGKGFRPSLAHFSAYLDAMETKEGWALVQVILPTVDGRDPTVIFRRKPRLRSFITGPDGSFREHVTATFGEIKDAGDSEIYKYFVEGPAVPDMGAPHDTLLNVKVKSNFGKKHLSSATYTKGAWWFATQMIGDEITASERMYGYPDAWQHPGEDNWHGMPDRKIGKSPALGEPYTPADDPINPKHYGGTACAEIGERLSANSYQVLKYNWRLGEKDEEKVEIGKAIWYLDREMELAREGWCPILIAEPMEHHMRKLIADQPEWTQIVAKALMSWNRYGNIETLKGLRRKLMSHKSMSGDDNGVTTGLAV